MNLQTPPLQRVLLASPIFFALLSHAILLDRWLLAILAAIGLVFAIRRSTSWSPTSRQWYIVIGAGLLVGLMIPAAEMSAGPLPPAAAAALTGVAVAIALFAVYSGKTTVGWAAAWALVTISGKIEFSGLLRVALFGFLLTSLVAMAWHARIIQRQIRGWLVFGVFAAALGLCTAGIASIVLRVDQLFLNSVEQFVANQKPFTITGLGNSLSLSEKSTIIPSMDPVLELSTKTGFLRAKVMDQFKGDRWSTSSKLFAKTPEAAGTIDSSINQRDIEMIFLDMTDDSIPSPAGTSRIADAESNFAGGWILRGKSNLISVSLRGDSNEQLFEESAGQVDDLELPDDLKDRLGPVARELTHNATSNVAKAKAIESFFQQNFQYSLTTDLTGDDHPLVTLVNERSPAYCVYFASAMALMLRSQGVPARIVTGFVPGEVNPISGKVIVRGRDTHAWVEAWSPEENRFFAFDPTPTESRRQLMGHNDSVNYVTALIGATRSAVRRIWLLLRYQPSSGLVALMVSPLLWLGLGLLSVIALKIRKRPALERSTKQNARVDPRIKRVYDVYQSSLQKAGITLRISETDDELLIRLETLEDPPLLDAAKEFLHRYRDTRFGGQNLVIDSDLEKLARLQYPKNALRNRGQ